ncbi:MAG TPA: NIL domain-containing protein [Candidatus Angelobacter sp.]|nr:NIL domain-containing protein [Candidatus Angelobacter sp.]
MPSSQKKFKSAATINSQSQAVRLWLMYPPKLIKTPMIWQLGHKFKVATNVRQASVTDEIGVVCLELDGKRAEIKAAIRWLVKQGVSVEPVEINVIES